MTTPPIPKPGPHQVELLADYQYAWCTCGLSGWQPFCDGSHTMAGPNARPRVFIQQEDKKVVMCGCRRTKQPPMCDHSQSFCTRVDGSQGEAS